MADFLQEKAAAGKAKKPQLPQPKLRLAELATPRPPKKQRSRRDRELAELLRDFRLGLTSLRGLTQRLQATKPDYRAQRGPTPPAPPAITKIVERERKIIERALAPLPAKEREILIREYERNAQSVMTAQAPQAYAAIIRGAELATALAQSGATKAAPISTPSAASGVVPAPVLRPNQPHVKELMIMAKAIRSGRLPFLPKEVVTRARQLLSVLFGKQQAAEMVTSRDTAMRRLIGRYRLVPRSVQAAVSATPKRKLTRAQQTLQALISRAITPRSSTAAAQKTAPIELAHLEQQGVVSPQTVAALPAMHTGGVAGPGEYRMQNTEGLHVITQDDSMVSMPSPGDVPDIPRKPSTAASGQPGLNVKPPPTSAPPPAKSAVPAGMKDPKPAPIRSEGTRAIFSDAGTAQPKGTLKISDIEGLASWVARAEERLNESNV